jgi:hypothetical protein
MVATSGQWRVTNFWDCSEISLVAMARNVVGPHAGIYRCGKVSFGKILPQKLLVAPNTGALPPLSVDMRQRPLALLD